MDSFDIFDITSGRPELFRRWYWFAHNIFLRRVEYAFQTWMIVENKSRFHWRRNLKYALLQPCDKLQIHSYTIVTKLRIKVHFNTILLIKSSRVFSLGFILQKLLLKTCLNITISSNHYVVFYETVFICALQTKVNNLTCHQSPQSFPIDSKHRSYLRFRVFFRSKYVRSQICLSFTAHSS